VAGYVSIRLGFLKPPRRACAWRHADHGHARGRPRVRYRRAQA
jgi:hypothetical protein